MDKSSGGKFPAPIFTKRKPRQALFAHPNNSSNNNDASGSYTQKANGSAPAISGFRPDHGSNPNIKPASNKSKLPQKEDSKMSLYNRPRAPHSPRPSTNQTQLQRPTRTDYSNSVTSSGSYNARTVGYSNTRVCTVTSQKQFQDSGARTNCSQKRPYNSSCGPGTNSSHTQVPSYRHSQGQGLPTNQSAPVSARQHYNSNAWDNQWNAAKGIEYSTAAVPSSGNPIARDGVTSDSYGPSVVPQYGQMPWGSPDKPDYSNTRNIPANNATFGAGMSSTSMQAGPLNNTPMKDITNTTRIESSSIRKPQMTTRFITATIEGMKHWSQYSVKVPLFFEILGVLYSAVSIDNESVSASFVLKDDQDSITCLFYQIDRELARLVRGRTYRCVGTLIQDRGAFHCISIRQTQTAQELKPGRLVSTSDRAMRALVAKLAEI